MPTRYLLSIIAVLALIGAAFYAFALFFAPEQERDATPGLSQGIVEFAKTGRVLSDEESRIAQEEAEKILSAGRAGNYDVAATQVQEMLKSEAEDKFTVAQIAHARHNSIYAYRDSAKIADAIEHIGDLKAVILDESLSLRRRARSLNSLATAYCGYGRDDRVLEVVFQGEPWSDHWKGAPGPSGMSLLMWGYEELLPTPRGATAIAHMHANTLIMNSALSESERADHIEQAKYYLGQGEELATTEFQRSENYSKSRRYVSHLFWRAFSIKVLELEGEGLAHETAEEAYQKFFDVVAGQNSRDTYQYLPYANILLAKFAQIDGKDDAVIHAFVDESIRLIREDPDPESNEMAQFLVDIAPHDAGGFAWKAMRDMALFSPRFSALVAEILTTMPND